MPTDGEVKRHDMVTVDTSIGIGVGHVHTVVSSVRFFVQVHVGSTVINEYVHLEDEGKKWIRGRDIEKLKALIGSDAAEKTE